MDYRKYYKEIKERLKGFSDVVYFESMQNNEILDIEKRIGNTVKPLYREYLSVFGMEQDVFDELKTDIFTFFEDFEFIKDSLKDYLPILTDKIKSIIHKTEQLLDIQKIKYDKIECKLIENE